MDLKDFNLEHWWKMTAAGGAVITAASAPTGFVPGFLAGLGLLLFGIGEWVAHPQVQFPVQGNAYRPSGIVTTHERRRTVLGGALDVVGVCCFAVGLWRLLTRL